VRLFRKTFEERRPIFDAVISYAEQADVRGGSNEALLQVLAKSIVDGEGDDERGDAGGDSEDGDAGDDADESLASFGTQVAGRYEEFKAHERAISSQLSVKSDYSDWVFDVFADSEIKALTAEGAEFADLGLGRSVHRPSS
jgi:hypothetical protein